MYGYIHTYVCIILCVFTVYMYYILHSFRYFKNLHKVQLLKFYCIRLCFFLEYFMVQLTTSSNSAITPAQYLLHIQPKTIVGYNTVGSQEVAWTWSFTDLCGYRLDKTAATDVQIIIGA